MAPTINSEVRLAALGLSFAYQIVATDSPTEYSARGLPNGLSLDASTGRISGVPLNVGSISIALSAKNNEGIGEGVLVLQIIAATSPKDTALHEGEFAPFDYTDGRKKSPSGVYAWQTRYEPEARDKMFWEARYLLTVFFGSVIILAVVVIYLCNCSGPFEEAMPVSVRHDFLCALLIAWFSGVIGGCLFSMKWLYHSIAKGLWSEDRNFWRVLTPHMSGATATFVVVIAIGTGITSVLKNEVVHSLTGISALAFLSGYFSDKALAKLSEVADSLFGSKTERKRD